MNELVPNMSVSIAAPSDPSLLDPIAIDKIDTFNGRSRSIRLVRKSRGGYSIPLHHFHANRHKYVTLASTDAKRPTPVEIKLSPEFSLRKYQHDVSEECVARLLRHRTLFLNVRCGWGKTAMGIYLFSRLGGRIMILHDNQLIESGWMESVQRFTSIVPTIMDRDHDYSTDASSSVFIASVDSFCNFDEARLPTGINVLFVDETKCFCTEKRITQLLKCSCEYLIGASADIDRTDGMHAALEFFFGPREDYVQKRWDGDFDYVRFFTNVKPEVAYTSVGWGASARRALDWNKVLSSCSVHQGFNDFVVGLVHLLAHKKILIVSKYVKQVNYLYQRLHEDRMDVVRLSGKGKTHADANVVVATIKKCYKGYDVATASRGWDGRHFEVVIITTDLESIEQVFGRGFRVEHPIILDFVHDLPKLYQHATVRKQWCDERNATVFTHHVRM